MSGKHKKISAKTFVAIIAIYTLGWIVYLFIIKIISQ